MDALPARGNSANLCPPAWGGQYALVFGREHSQAVEVLPICVNYTGCLLIHYWNTANHPPGLGLQTILLGFPAITDGAFVLSVAATQNSTIKDPITSAVRAGVAFCNLVLVAQKFVNR